MRRLVEQLGAVIGTAACFALSQAGLPSGASPVRQSSAAANGKAQTAPSATVMGTYNIRAFGAVGDGKTLDSPAINRAIEAAAVNGGGTIQLPAGTYLSASIRLKSNIALSFDPGAILVAADSANGTTYDAPEENPAAKNYQDYGHNHWHNSLIWGENLENVALVGPGRIWGKGLVRSESKPAGTGNKAIGLKNCRNVTIRDISVLHGGWFAILATGVDNLTIDNVQLDTNRDGMDIDCCRQVHILNCSVNSPRDDGICLKSSYALGTARATENVTITNCQVSGYDEGTLLDGTFQRTGKYGGGRYGSGPFGRIKFGTESNGGFKNITISNCVFDYCRGLALESVDGASLEDIAISNITMRDIVNAPIFLRLGRRMRGPEGSAVGTLRRVSLSHFMIYNADPHQACLIAGIPGHALEDIRLNDIHVYSRGGGTTEQAARALPEDETGYPEPSFFGDTPAYGFFVRHVKGLSMTDVSTQWAVEDRRPALVLDEVDGATLNQVDMQRAKGTPGASLVNVQRIAVHDSRGLPNTDRETVTSESL